VPAFCLLHAETLDLITIDFAFS